MKMLAPKFLASLVLAFCEQHSCPLYGKLTAVKGETHQQPYSYSAVFLEI